MGACRDYDDVIKRFKKANFFGHIILLFNERTYYNLNFF